MWLQTLDPWWRMGLCIEWCRQREEAYRYSVEARADTIGTLIPLEYLVEKEHNTLKLSLT